MSDWLPSPEIVRAVAWAAAAANVGGVYALGRVLLPRSLALLTAGAVLLAPTLLAEIQTSQADLLLSALALWTLYALLRRKWWLVGVCFVMNFGVTFWGQGILEKYTLPFSSQMGDFWVNDFRWALTLGLVGAVYSNRRKLSGVPSLVWVLFGLACFQSINQRYLLFAIDALYLVGAWGFDTLTTAAAQARKDRKPLRPALLSPLALALIAVGGAISSFGK